MNTNGYANVIELETFVYSIGIKDKEGKEIVINIDTNIKNN